MTIYTAPKLRRYWPTMPLLLASISFLLWAFLKDTSSSRYGILFVGIVWCSYLFILLLRSGQYAKSVEVVDDSLHVNLLNGKNIHFSLNEVQKVQVKHYLGFQEAIITTKHTANLRLTSHLSDFDALIKAMSYSPEKEKISKKDTRTLVLFFAFSLFVVVLSVVLAYSQESRLSTILYFASALGALICIIIIWMIYKINKYRNNQPKCE